MAPIQQILFATDLSQCSKYAFQMACALARDYNARLTLTSVVPLQSAMIGIEGMIIPPPPPRDHAQLRTELAQLAKDALLANTKVVVCEGDPSEEILLVAKDVKADLIIMGTHGRSGVGRLMLGSVAEYVLRRSTCPVLTVKTPEPDTAPNK